MSTSSNILVVNKLNVQQFYHHWDGYLSGVGEELRLMVNEAITNNELPFYDAIMRSFECDESYELEELMATDHENYLHGDIEFLYIIKDKNLYYVKSWDLCHRFRTNQDLIDYVCTEENKIDLAVELID